MNAYKAEAVLTEDGKLILTGLPFQAGRRVEVIVLEHELKNPLTDAIDDDRDYLTGVSALMMEWNSEEDELAYGNLSASILN
jgi:hypothetical protein